MSTKNPGWVNAHTHLYSGLAPLGMPEPAEEPQNLLEILERVWWRLDRSLDASSLRAAARLYVAEALLAGTTAIVDHHESPAFIEGSLDVLADVCQELGMRAVLCYGATERNGGREEGHRGLAECRRFIESNNRPLVRGVVGLHASFTLSNRTIFNAGKLARTLGTVVHVHVAEGLTDVRDAQSREYESPLQRLLELKALPPGSILAHGVHLSRTDVKKCAEQDLWLVQNPRSNTRNGVGYPFALEESDHVAIGTDGYPSDREEEGDALRVAAEMHDEDREKTLRRLDAGHQLVAPLLGPGVETEVGEGRVVVGGREVIKDGKLMTGDLDEIRAQAREEAEKLWERMRAL
ncbi:MAG: amidohydrolase family protein [Planctomycetota bacterium]